MNIFNRIYSWFSEIEKKSSYILVLTLMAKLPVVITISKVFQITIGIVFICYN